MGVMRLFFDVYVQIFFVLTPFFVLSMFLAMTRDYREGARKALALKVAGAVIVISLILFVFGRVIFMVFGITTDAFKVGAGVLLLLSAISMVSGNAGSKADTERSDIAVVPLAIPITVGPATIGVLLVMGAELTTVAQKLVAGSALVLAAMTVSLLLYMASGIERRLGTIGLNILSKLTGLMLAAIAAQLILTGVKHFLQ
ncbi:MAG TPA: MarC family protein [Armatimonadota bacterium]|nr:MarC family protein [Armatimonadota bacterium]